MKDEVQTIRQRLQDLHESHVTGFADDAQYAQARALLERKLVDAVMRGAPTPPAIAEVAPASAVAEPPPPAARIQWLPWLAAAAAAHVLVGLAYWWSASGSSSASSVASSKAPSVAAAAAQAPETLASAAAVIDNAPLLTPAAVVTGTSITGTVYLTPALALKARASDTVFVFARAVDGPPMPLAVIRKQVKDLPLQFTLDDSMAMWPAAKVSAYPRVVVTARVSKSGEGQARPGDLQGESPVVAAGVAGLRIEIGTVVEK
ncbi:MAG: hypothetical protein H7Z15_03650 [Rhizobacter sp.]|nr:hypothetical protein [Rhizobacter sp.]